MDLYPLDLVLATGLAWATVFFAALPAGLMRAHIFQRTAAVFGVAWMLVAAIAPPSILHYYIFLGLMCLYAWRQLRHDRALSAKMWLCIAGGVGISLGVILILVITPGAYPTDLPLETRLWLLASIYLGGAVAGLGVMLYVLTRLESTRAGVPLGILHGSSNLLVVLTLAVAAMKCVVLPARMIPTNSADSLSDLAWILFVIVLPFLGWAALRHVRSPAPSLSKIPLLGFCLVAVLAQILALA